MTTRRSRILASVLLLLAAAPVAWADEPVTKASMLREAVAASDSIEDVHDRVRKLVTIALAQMKAGDEPAAKETLGRALAAAELTGSAYRYDNIVAAQITMKDFAAAAAVAESLGDRKRKADALGKIAAAQAEAGAGPAAAATFRQALEAAESIAEAGPRAGAIAAVTAGQAEAGDRPAAAASLTRALAAAESIKDDPPRLSRALATIAQAQAAIADRDAIAETLKRALAAAGSIEEPGRRSYALQEIAAVQVDLDDQSAAGVTLQLAFSAAGSIDDADARRLTLLSVGHLQMTAGDRTGAARSFAGARDLAASLPDGRKRDQSLSTVAAFQAGLDLETMPDAFRAALTTALSALGGDGGTASPAQAVTALPPRGDADAALFTARLIVGPGFRSLALREAAAPWLAAGDRVTLELFLRDMALAERDIQVEDQRVAFVESYETAVIRIATGDLEGPLSLAREIEWRASPDRPAFLHAYIAWAQAQTGDVAAAKAVLSHILRFPPPASPDDRQSMRRLLALVQAKLGDLPAALEIARHISDPGIRAAALMDAAMDAPPPGFRSLMTWAPAAFEPGP